MESPEFGRRYNWDNGYVVYHSTMYHPNGYLCRVYDTTFQTPNGLFTKREVACQENGYWVHGYNQSILISEMEYRRRMAPPVYMAPPVIVVPPPVIYYPPRCMPGYYCGPVRGFERHEMHRGGRRW